MVDFAPCPQETPPSTDPPSSTVVVRILSIKPNSDLEGDDDYVPFYNNKADIYGIITIDGQEFELPQITDNNFPHWYENGAFSQEVSSVEVPISIDIWEGDSGATGDDDHVDINSDPDKFRLDLIFDLCSLRLSGDITNASTQGVITSSGSGGNNAATIRFKVELEDSRPVSEDDLALVDIDLVQVIYRSERLVARKPTLVMARVANNFNVTVNSNLRVQISGSGIPTIDDTFPIAVEPGEVKKFIFYQGSPLFFPASATPYEIAIVASIEDPGSAGLNTNDCRRHNDAIANRILWKVVTSKPLSMLWMKVGTLLDVGNYVSDSQFNEIHELGTPYIEGVFPLINPISDKAPVPLPPPPLNAAMDTMIAILASFQIPIDALEPFAFLFELNNIAILSGYDRLMGVLPTHDWFKRFSYWDDVTGLSLGEFAPHAVIFQARNKADSGVIGPQMTLPAHELGHTYGLSTDSSLKKSWICEIDWPNVGSLPCGATGGFDEYKNDDPAFQDGNPASGIWVEQGGEPGALQGLLNREQCDSHCFMGPSPVNAHLNWANDGRWIDAADYDELLDKLSLQPDPEVIYVSGIIAWNDQIYLGPMYHLPAGTPDRVEADGLYAFRFEDEQGSIIQEIGLPIHWNIPEYDRAMPITFFGLLLPYPEPTRHIKIINRGNGRVLVTRDVSQYVPSVEIQSPQIGYQVNRGATISVEWIGRDQDQDVLTYTVLMSPNRDSWWPIGNQLSLQQYEVQTDVLSPGVYYVKVLACDGVHIRESQIVSFEITSDDYSTRQYGKSTANE